AARRRRAPRMAGVLPGDRGAEPAGGGRGRRGRGARRGPAVPDGDDRGAGTAPGRAVELPRRRRVGRRVRTRVERGGRPAYREPAAAGGRGRGRGAGGALPR